MLRNFDLPEALVFYGIDSIVDTSDIGHQISDISNNNNSQKPAVLRPGVLRLMKESIEIQTPIIILSEHLTMDEIAYILQNSVTDESIKNDMFSALLEEQLLHYRSSLEEFPFDLKNNKSYNVDNDDEDYEHLPTFQGKGMGHAPSPASLLDAIHTILIEPRGFGGSAGFGTKFADAARSPLPQHVVVFVSRSSDDSEINTCSERKKGALDGSSGSLSRDRCIASRVAGMRVVYIEDGNIGSCTAEDVCDGVVETLGSDSDWDIVTMDDISTPGSFWLNMAVPKDENGDRVYTSEVIDYYQQLRTKTTKDNGSFSESIDDDGLIENTVTQELNEEDIEKILADLDSL